MSNDIVHELTCNIDHYLAVLSKLYKQQGEVRKLEIIVNAIVRTVDGLTYDGWNGGIYGHGLYLTLPEATYLANVHERDKLQRQICDDINKLHDVQGEFFSEVFFEMETSEDGDWRRESGVLQGAKRQVPPAVTDRIWAAGYRVFLSHKVGWKIETAKVKEALKPFGISCFVAHEDIHPTKEWQEEIENALSTMDAFVALMTPDFHESEWTDQEVGYAVGRGVPIIAAKLGRTPYGFLGKFQALATDWANAHLEIMKILAAQPRMLDAFIGAVPRCGSFDEGNTLSTLFPFIERLTDVQAETLRKAYNANSELKGSFGFNGQKSHYYGVGLRQLIKRTTGRELVRDTSTRNLEFTDVRR